MLLLLLLVLMLRRFPCRQMECRGCLRTVELEQKSMTFHGLWFACLVAIAYFMVSEAFSNPLSAPQQQQVFARIMLNNFKLFILTCICSL
jgi:hypothetical protein